MKLEDDFIPNMKELSKFLHEKNEKDGLLGGVDVVEGVTEVKYNYTLGLEEIEAAMAQDPYQ